MGPLSGTILEMVRTHAVLALPIVFRKHPAKAVVS